MTALRRDDLYARRNATFAREFTFTEVGGGPVDFTGAQMVLEVRLHGAAPGDALIRLTGVDAPGHGLYATPGAIAAVIDEADITFLPAGRSGADATFAWDLVIARPGEVPRNWRWGVLTVAPAVTQRLSLRTTEAGDARVTEDGAYRVTE